MRLSTTDSNHSDLDCQQLKLITLQLRQDQQSKLGAPSPPTLTFIKSCNRTILSVDAFVSQVCQLIPHIKPIQALQLLQECIKIMPKTGANGRPVGRLGWFEGR